MSISLQEGIEQLEQSLGLEGELVLRSLRGCINALAERDVELADEVIAFDDDVDRVYSDLQEGVHTLLARQTPVAVDLRHVLAMLHVNLHLERMADYCVTIAKMTKLSADLPPHAGLLSGFEEIGSRAEEMIRVAMDSFLSRDLDGASRLVDLDELIDNANRRIVGNVLEIGNDLALREWGLWMIVVSRCFERIGDHAVDIGEQTYYYVTGEFREFTDASHPEGVDFI